jgi:prepilin-type N-terminal cleavage/methylation domain-containing protein
VRGGFTLLEVMVAFAILAMVLSALASVQFESLEKAADAVDYREIREAADTVFRKIVYELDKPVWPDGRLIRFDYDYAEYIGLPPAARDAWFPVRGVLRKQTRMAAGTDPTGQTPGVEGERTGAEDVSTRPTSGEPPPSGEAVYYVSLEVYVGEEEQMPFLTLTTYEPLPASERKAAEAGRR